MNTVYHMDCMEVMKQYPDGYFDLAVVDPVYGDVPSGGYMSKLVVEKQNTLIITMHCGSSKKHHPNTLKSYFE